MALTVTIYNTTGAAYAFTEILSFQLKKEVYTPYTAFSAQLDTGWFAAVWYDLSNCGTVRQQNSA